MNKLQFIKPTLTLSIILAFAFCITPLKAQHLFSVNYNELSRNTITELQSQILDSEISTLSLTKNNENRDIFQVEYSTVENTKIVILNEQTDNHVVIIPTSKAQTYFELAPFFVEELRQGALGDANRFLVLVSSEDFSVKSVSSVSVSRNEVYIPQYFYGPKEAVKEALPKDRQIISILKQKPKLILAYNDNIDLQNFASKWEEDRSYYIYIFVLPDGTVCTYDEHFNPGNTPSGIRSGANLLFSLSGNLGAQETAATLHAFNLWGEQLAGTILVDIEITSLDMGNPNVIGASYRMPNFLNTGQVPSQPTYTYYPSPLWNQLVGYDATTQYDIVLEMNSTFNFYYGITGNPGSNQIDWTTVMLHEICHGLGFYPLCGSNGAWSLSPQYPGTFDRQLFQGTTGPCITELTQSQRAALMTSGNLYAGAPASHLLTANSGSRVQMYAPTSYAPGSSNSHWNTTVTFPTFMKHQIAYGFKLHSIGTRKVGMMLDIGWEQPNSSQQFTVTLSANPTGSGTVTGAGNYFENANVTVTATPNAGYLFVNWTENGTPVNTNASYSFTIVGNRTLVANFQPCGVISTFPHHEGFESNGAHIPQCWSQGYVTGTTAWTIVTSGNGSPGTVQEGTRKALIVGGASQIGHKTRLVTPPINLSGVDNPTLRFWHTQLEWSGDQDKLRIFYKTSASGAWTLLQEYTGNVSNWTQRTISLPNKTANYYIAFEAELGWGYGVQLDNIRIEGVNLTCNPVTNLAVNYVSGCSGAQITWSAPTKSVVDSVEKNTWLTWWQGTISNVVGGGAPESFGIFHRYAVSDISSYAGQYITKIKYMPYSFTSGSNPPTVFLTPPRIQVYVGGSIVGGNYNPGNLVANVQHTNYTFNEDNEVILPNPVLITGTQEVWFGVSYEGTGYPGTSSAPNSQGSIYNKSNIFRIDDIWGETSEFFLDAPIYCWYLFGWVEPSASQYTFNIYRNGILIKANHTGTSYTDTEFNPTVGHTWAVETVCPFGTSTQVSVALGACGVFVPVTNITGVPTSATVGVPLTLSGTVLPSNATNRTITWSVSNAGTTGASINGNTFNATATGTAEVTATIVNGLAPGTNYMQVFYITVGKGTQTAPPAPTMASNTQNSITLNTIAGCEYRMVGGNWQSSVLFDNLTINSNYSFEARRAETATHLASPVSPSAQFSTKKATLTGTVTINGTPTFGETLNANTSGLTSNPVVHDLGVLTYQWKRNGVNVGTNSSNYTLQQTDIGNTITVTVATANSEGSITSSPTSIVTKAQQPAPDAPTLANATTTSIELNPITDCEFRKDAGLWQSSPLFTELTPNTTYSFEARKRETPTHFASPPSVPKSFSTLTVGVKESEFAGLTVYSYSNSVYIKNESKTALKSIEITDMIGRQVYQNTIFESETVIKLDVANGFYNVRLLSQDDNVVVVKISISR